jgi:hypothetical protein
VSATVSPRSRNAFWNSANTWSAVIGSADAMLIDALISGGTRMVRPVA